MNFRLVPKSVTLDDPERRNGRYIALLISGPAFYCIYTEMHRMQSASTRTSDEKAVRLFVRLQVCLSICLSVCLPVCQTRGL